MMKAADPKKNLIKTLRGDDLKVANPEADAIPSRTKAEIKAENSTQTVSLEKRNNGHANGHTNGKVKSSPNGIVLTPIEGNSEQTSKKKKKR
jgi:hypothetical protein